MTTRCPGTWLPGCWTCPKILLCIVFSARHCVHSYCEYATCTKQNKRLKFKCSKYMVCIYNLTLKMIFYTLLFFFFPKFLERSLKRYFWKVQFSTWGQLQHFRSDHKEALHHQVVVLAGSTSFYYRDGNRHAFAAVFFLLFSRCCLILYLFLQRAATTWV